MQCVVGINAAVAAAPVAVPAMMSMMQCGGVVAASVVIPCPCLRVVHACACLSESRCLSVSLSVFVCVCLFLSGRLSGRVRAVAVLLMWYR